MVSKKSGLTKRQKEIIKILAQFTADHPITVQTISEKLNLSSRTILREMPKIDAWFEENDFHLVKKPRIGLYVDEDQETRNFLQELVQMEHRKAAFTKEERKDRILSELLTKNEPLKYFYFTSMFHISDGTLSNDLDDLEHWMEHYNLSMVRRPGIGISWDGKEEDYRQAAAVLFQKLLKGKDFKTFFEEDNLHPIARYFQNVKDILDDLTVVVSETQRVLNIQYTEQSRLHFTLYLLLTVKRLKDGYPINGRDKDLMPIMHLPECQVSNWIGSKIGQIVGFPISEGEVYCISMQLLSEKIWKNKNESKYEEESFKIRQIVIKIAVNMEQLLDTDFLGDPVLIDGLCNHMRPAINRMKMGVFSENGHLEIIKQSWERKLTAISKGKQNDRKFMKEIQNYTEELIQDIKTSEGKFRHDNMTRQKCPQCGKFLLSVNGKHGKLLVCQDRECGYKKTLSRSTNARCPVCHKKMELVGDGENQKFVCSCGHKEKLSAFKARKEKEGNSMSKKEVRRYLKKQQKEAEEPVNNAFAEALSKIKL